jgi:hypothetical protein
MKKLNTSNKTSSLHWTDKTKTSAPTSFKSMFPDHMLDSREDKYFMPVINTETQAYLQVPKWPDSYL